MEFSLETQIGSVKEVETHLSDAVVQLRIRSHCHPVVRLEGSPVSPRLSFFMFNGDYILPLPQLFCLRNQ